MKPWEIWTYDFPGIGPHPAVIISGPERAERKTMLEVLRCSSARAGRAAGFGEVVLNSEDGLDWETLCFCDCVWTAPRVEVSGRRGLVTLERRRAIVSAILQSHRWIDL